MDMTVIQQAVQPVVEGGLDSVSSSAASSSPPLPSASTSHSPSRVDEHHSSLTSLLTVLVMALGALHLGGSKARTKRRGKGGERRFLRTSARQGHGTKRPHNPNRERSAHDAVTKTSMPWSCLYQRSWKGVCVSIDATHFENLQHELPGEGDAHRLLI
jgi:hypothetical protein